jgi:hypothetical protein
MVVKMVGMMCRSSGCEGMYKCIKSKDVRGRFASFVIWRYGEISGARGIFDILLG